MATEVAIKFFTIIFLVLSGYDHSVKVSSNSEVGSGTALWDYFGFLREWVLNTSNFFGLFYEVSLKCEQSCGGTVLKMRQLNPGHFGSDFWEGAPCMYKYQESGIFVMKAESLLDICFLITRLILPETVPVPPSFFLHSGFYFHQPVLGKLPLQPKLRGKASDVTEI